MCKCCEEIEFFKEMNKKYDKENGTFHKMYSQIAIYGWRKDIKIKIRKRANSVITTKTFTLNYCPECGRKLGG